MGETALQDKSSTSERISCNSVLKTGTEKKWLWTDQ